MSLVLEHLQKGFRKDWHKDVCPWVATARCCSVPKRALMMNDTVIVMSNVVMDLRNHSLSLSLYIYICTHIYLFIYVSVFVSHSL